MQPPTQGGGRKRQNLTLDLNSASAKKNRVQNLLTSPELEKFLSQNPTLATPTPSGYIFPKSVTEEQAMYAKGFEEALEHLRATEPPGSSDLAAANTLATLSTASVPLPNRGTHPNPPDLHPPPPQNLPLSLHPSLP